jgi:hypothetical protein
VLPQLMPAGALVTVPVPVPALLTERVKVWASWELNVAVQVVLAFIVTAPLLQPVPLQPENVELAAGMAVNVTVVPLVYVAEQMLPQLIPADRWSLFRFLPCFCY